MHQPTSPTAAHIHTHEPHGILDKFRSTKRRLIQQALTKMGKADCSDDSEYQVLRDRQLELTSNVEHVFVHMKSFVTNLVCDDMTMIRTDLATRDAIHSQAYGVKTTSGGDDFTKSMALIDATARELAGSMLSANVIVDVQCKLDELHQFKKELEHRENLKLDYDSAVRKLRKARESREAADVLRRDEKLKVAQTKLTQATEIMVAKMKEYELARPTMLQKELAEFRQMQAKFFQLCVTSFAGSALPPMSAKTDQTSHAEAVKPSAAWN
ncbi:hypothetical protein, variant [Aphanomyces invadans]|uniref:BAR domain-containing protein n=1 Tax=Aphanomyces invadans TaxID=157072 RepID=A0A024USE8_9STRA|nr:hypothetical protein, variant [Aphanomyces invadans]ETW09401.1 hypothetical protein, variant [Aphanomyces invadans]|eukprot:XP_008860812.1 hypothetical protein, variant [Aphanomyces invadans]